MSQVIIIKRKITLIVVKIKVHRCLAATDEWLSAPCACGSLMLVVAGYYLIPIIGRPEPRAVYWDKFGQPAIEAEYITSFPDTWWWDEARAARIRQKN